MVAPRPRTLSVPAVARHPFEKSSIPPSSVNANPNLLTPTPAAGKVQPRARGHPLSAPASTRINLTPLPRPVAVRVRDNTQSAPARKQRPDVSSGELQATKVGPARWATALASAPPLTPSRLSTCLRHPGIYDG